MTASSFRTSGFTLIETLIAVTILTLAISGPLFTASRAIVAAQNAKDRLTASYLAQEAIEYVRMMRDNEYLEAYQSGAEDITNTAWDNFLNGSLLDAGSIRICRAPGLCTLDPVLGTLSRLDLCSAGNERSDCPVMYLTGCTTLAGVTTCVPPNVYTQQEVAGSISTSFRRTIQAIDISPSEEKIVATVSWDYHGTPYEVTISDHLTPWQ